MLRMPLLEAIVTAIVARRGSSDVRAGAAQREHRTDERIQQRREVRLARAGTEVNVIPSRRTVADLGKGETLVVVDACRFDVCEHLRQYSLGIL